MVIFDELTPLSPPNFACHPSQRKTEESEASGEEIRHRVKSIMVVVQSGVFASLAP